MPVLTAFRTGVRLPSPPPPDNQSLKPEESVSYTSADTTSERTGRFRQTIWRGLPAWFSARCSFHTCGQTSPGQLPQRGQADRGPERSVNMQLVRDFSGYFSKYLGKDGDTGTLSGRWWGSFNKRLLPKAARADAELEGKPEDVKRGTVGPTLTSNSCACWRLLHENAELFTRSPATRDFDGLKWCRCAVVISTWLGIPPR